MLYVPEVPSPGYAAPLAGAVMGGGEKDRRHERLTALGEYRAGLDYSGTRRDNENEDWGR